MQSISTHAQGNITSTSVEFKIGTELSLLEKCPRPVGKVSCTETKIASKNLLLTIDWTKGVMWLDAFRPNEYESGERENPSTILRALVPCELKCFGPHPQRASSYLGYRTKEKKPCPSRLSRKEHLPFTTLVIIHVPNNRSTHAL